MLGRIVSHEKGPNEAIPTFAIRPVGSRYFAVWFDASAVGETVTEAI